MSKQEQRKLHGRKDLCPKFRELLLKGLSKGFLGLPAKLLCPFMSMKFQCSLSVTLSSNKRALCCLKERKWLTIYIRFRLINCLANKCDKVPFLAQRNKTHMCSEASLVSKLPVLPSGQGKFKPNVCELPPSRKADYCVLFYLLINSFF